MKNGLSKLSASYHWIIEPVLVVAVLLFGFLSAMSLSSSRETPVSGDTAVVYAPLVKTIHTHIEDTHLLIKGNGTLQARTRIRIVPQVGGRITSIHPQLRAGGHFQAHETLLTIEALDYQLAVISAEAEVSTAQRTLDIEQAEAESARQEWFALNPNEAVPTLVGRTPQITEAKANRKAAQARLQQAQLNLKRTRIQMPFAGRVVESSVDVGEVVSANQSVGTVYSREQFEIPVPLALNQLTWITTAHAAVNGIGSPVRIMLPIAGEASVLEGQVERIESELDSTTRLARVVITLPASAIPLALRERIIPGLFVNIEIQARTLEAVTILPSALLHENNQLWTLADGQLKFLTPDIVYQSDTELYLRGLPADTVIVTSPLEVVTEGMQLRTMEPAE